MEFNRPIVLDSYKQSFDTMKSVNTELQNRLAEIFSRDDFNYCYNNIMNNLRVIGKRGNTDIYFRIVIDPSNTTKCTLDIANIIIDRTIRRRGLFRGIVKACTRVNHVKDVTVSNVLSEEMHKACLSLGFEYSPKILGYRMKIPTE